jgi:hypothetical protein
MWFLTSGDESTSSDDYDSKKRKQRAGGEPWGAKKPRHDLPPYRVHLTPYTVDRWVKAEGVETWQRGSVANGMVHPSASVCSGIVLFCFFGTGVWTRPSPWATPPALFLWWIFFEIGSHELFCLGWLLTMILLISSSSVARITVWAIGAQPGNLFKNQPTNGNLYTWLSTFAFSLFLRIYSILTFTRSDSFFWTVQCSVEWMNHNLFNQFSICTLVILNIFIANILVHTSRCACVSV